MRKIPALLCLAMLLAGTCVQAQNCDPWITKAYKELYNRNPTTEECNIKNYNNGSWNSYNELAGYIKKYIAAKAATGQLKGDPWIFQAYKELYNRTPNAWELNINNYNSGSWDNYAELKKYVGEFQASLSKNALVIKTGITPNNTAYVIFEKNGKVAGIDMVSLNGGNVVAAGGANVIAAGGANVVSAGGLNLQVSTSMAGVNFGNKYSVQAAGTTIVPASGKGALLFR